MFAQLTLIFDGATGVLRWIAAAAAGGGRVRSAGRVSMGADRLMTSMHMVTVKFLTVAFWQVG
jgi:hypothetical protein